MEDSKIIIYQTEDGNTKIETPVWRMKPFGLRLTKWQNFFKNHLQPLMSIFYTFMKNVNWTLSYQ